MTPENPTPPLPAGYDLIARDGERAGLADVLRVRRTADGAELTLTLVTALVSADERFRGYLLAVADRLRHVDHPGIVRVLDCGQHEGRAWVVSQPPAGRTVRSILRDGTIDPVRAIDLFEPLARALRAASEFGLHHRDLDIGNVLISVESRALLCETAFIDPLAIPYARETRPDLLTYVPPERLRQAPPDPRADVHLLGGLLLTALTGHPPGSHADLVLRDRERKGAVPEELDLVLWKALAADPLQRPATPRDLFHQARRALGGEAPERFIRQPQPSVSGKPAASTDVVRWSGPGNVANTLRGPQRLVGRFSAGVSGWSTAAGRIVRDAGGGISGFVSRLRPGGSRTGYTDAERPPTSAAASRPRPAGELDAPSDDGDPHPAGSAPARAANGAAPPDADPAARLGAAAERLRRATPPPSGSAAVPVAVATAAPVVAPAPPSTEPGPEPEAEPAADDADTWPSTDPAVRLRTERARRRRSLLVGTAAVAALAIGTGIVVGSGDDDPATQQAPAAQQTRQGPVTLTHPPQWQTVDPVPQVLGVDLQDPVALEPRGVPGFVPGSATLVAGTFGQTDATLLPPGLAEQLQTAPDGEAIRVGDLEGYRYRDLARPDEAGVVDLYVFGTDQGTLAVSCFTGIEVSAALRSQCATIAGSLRPEGVSAVPLGPSAEYGRALRAAIDRYNRDRDSLRRQLRDARTPQGQSRISNRLADVSRQAAGRLASIQAPAAVDAEHQQIIRQVRLVANSYDRMASAARADSRTAFNRARGQVREREARLDALLRGLRDAGYRLD